MNKIIKQAVKLFSISLLLITLVTPLALAENGGGTGGGLGNGTGGKTDIALTLTSSSIKSGSVNVPLNPVIDLQFNKNVVNLTVKDYNSKCFHLTDKKGNSVTIKIIFPDDQLRREYKEHIFITPEKRLTPNSKYTLYIDRTLQAKNRRFIDGAHMIAFTTGRNATSAVNASLKDLAGDIYVYTNKLPTTKESYSNKVTVRSSAVKAAPQSINNNSLSTIIIGAILIIAVLFAVLLFFAKNKGKNKHSGKP